LFPKRERQSPRFGDFLLSGGGTPSLSPSKFEREGQGTKIFAISDGFGQNPLKGFVNLSRRKLSNKRSEDFWKKELVFSLK
jgi:hypothetical protein